MLTVFQNGNNNNNNLKKGKLSKTQNPTVVIKKEKGRRGNSRRHSNKENRCETKLINKCSSSIWKGKWTPEDIVLVNKLCKGLCLLRA